MTEIIAFKLVSIFLAFGFLLLAYFSKRIVGCWLSPASIFPLFWFVYTLLPFFVAFNAPVNPFAVLYIFAFNLAFVSSVVIFNWRVAFRANLCKKSSAETFNTFLFRLMFYVASFIAIVFLLSGVFSQGFSFGDIISNPIAVAGGYAKKRYADEIVVTVFSKLGLLSSYIAVVFGGLFYGSIRSGQSKMLVVFFAFLPSLLVMILQSAKGLFFFSIFLFCGGILVSRIHDKNYQLITYGAAKTLLIYTVFVLPVIIMSFLARGLYGSSDSEYVFFKLKRYLITYSSGHIYAFSDWFSERYFAESVMIFEQKSITVGFYTWMSFFRMLGDDRSIPMGVYNEFYFYGDYIVTNIYTVFRGLIIDFGLIGSLMMASFFGLLSNFVFYRLLCSKDNAVYIIFFVFFVAISYQTYIISTFMWVTIPAVLVVQVVILTMYFQCLKIMKNRDCFNG